MLFRSAPPPPPSPFGPYWPSLVLAELKLSTLGLLASAARSPECSQRPHNHSRSHLALQTSSCPGSHLRNRDAPRSGTSQPWSLPRVSQFALQTPLQGSLTFPLGESARPSALEHPFLRSQQSSGPRSLGCPSPRPGLSSTPPTLPRAWREEGRPQGSEAHPPPKQEPAHLAAARPGG